MKKRKVFIFTVGIIATSISLALHDTVPTNLTDSLYDYSTYIPWASQGGKYTRSGQSTHIGPRAGVIKWIFEFEGAISGNIAVGKNGQILAACEEGLYCIDPNGILLWIYHTEAELTSSPSLGSDQTTYVGDANGIFHAIDPDGNELWTYATGGPIYGAPAVSDNDWIYVSSEDGTLYALDKNGIEQWYFQTNGPGVFDGAILASPTIGLDGSIYTGGFYDSNLLALSPETGDVKWIGDEPAHGSKRTMSHPVVNDNNGMIYQITLNDPNLYAFNPSDGTIRWKTNLLKHEMIEENITSASGWYEPAIGPDGTIYASLDDPYIRAVEPNDGTIKWVAKLENSEGYHLVVDKTGYIYAAGDGGSLYIITPEGQPVASMQNGGKLGYPVIAHDHHLLITYNEVRVAQSKVESISRILSITDEPIVLQWEERLRAIPDVPETPGDEDDGHNKRP